MFKTILPTLIACFFCYLQVRELVKYTAWLHVQLGWAAVTARLGHLTDPLSLSQYTYTWEGNRVIDWSISPLRCCQLWGNDVQNIVLTLTVSVGDQLTGDLLHRLCSLLPVHANVKNFSSTLHLSFTCKQFSYLKDLKIRCTKGIFFVSKQCVQYVHV